MIMANESLTEGLTSHVLTAVISGVTGAIGAIWRTNKQSTQRFATLEKAEQVRHEELMKHLAKKEEQMEQRLDAMAKSIEANRAASDQRVREVEIVVWGRDGREGIQLRTARIERIAAEQRDVLLRLAALMERMYHDVTGQRAPAIFGALRAPAPTDGDENE